MATTTNYSWTTPDDTALVKDGALAIRTLGSSIDTTTKALNPSTTLGDIEYRSSTANTNTRLGIGTTGQVLSVSGGVPAWTTPAPAGAMTLLETLSLSGSSVTSGTLSSAYKQFLVYVTELYGSGAVSFQLRLNGDTGSNYSWETIDFAASASTDRADASAIFRLGNSSNDSGVKRRASGIITLMRPSDTNVVYVNANWTGYSGGLIGTVANGVYDSSAAITTITLFPSSGTMTAGTAYIYGVN